MKNVFVKSSLLMALGLSVFLSSSFVMADSWHGKDKHRSHYSHNDKRGSDNRAQRKYDKHKAVKHNQRHVYVKHHAPARPVYHKLPRDYRYVRNDIKPFGHAIRRGPALPKHYRVVRGHPLPHGYGHVLSHSHYNYLPHYSGYEWRSVGRDLVLVAATTGLVYAIVDNVLN